MNKNKQIIITTLMVLFSVNVLFGQEKDYDPKKMRIDVGNIYMEFDRLFGDGGMQSQFSWNLTGGNPQYTENFYWPRDQWQSNMLFQIFHPLVLDENGIFDEDSVKKAMYTRGRALTNEGPTDWASETRRYRPPHVVVDGIQLDPPYKWNVDPNLEADVKLEFEDVLVQFGLRSHVEVYAFSNPNHADYIIWKGTHKFTGETKLPRNSAVKRDTLVDQTIKFWWPASWSFGPSKAGEKMCHGAFGMETQDDLSSWFKRKSELLPNEKRDSLYVAYYWDYIRQNPVAYENGSTDEMGDPDRATGFLHATQIPGYTLLHSDKSASDKSDDINQPYAMPYASIVIDLWGRRDENLLLTYRGDDERGRFPLDRISEGQKINKGPMRFITCGPFELTKDSKAGRTDSVSMVYAIGAGGLNYQMADSIGKEWFNGNITDAEKDSLILTGKDSLFKTLDRANWAWNKLENGEKLPAAPPSPDIEVISGPERITVKWEYPENTYFNDAVTGEDDFYAWRVYRKQGALLVNDPLDEKKDSRWELVYETTDRFNTKYVDENVTRGYDYYYAVTAIDNGTQNTNGIAPGEKLESSKHMTRSLLPAVSFEAGLNTSDEVLVVPNPATVASGAALNGGAPDKISFFNLPIACELKIFTETGDLVKTISHYGTADEEWFQKTDDNQYVSPGIYILAVTKCKDINGKSLDNKFVKFVIVR